MLVVLGSINADVRHSVTFLPAKGETVIAKSCEISPGGKGANQALAARRCGVEVAMFGAVGNDPVSTLALQNLKDAGVDLAGVKIVEGATGTANVYVDSNGENFIVVVSGANAAVDEKAAELAAFQARNGFLVLQQELPASVVACAMNAATKYAAKTILNLSPVDTVSVSPSVTTADILILNEHEWRVLSGGLDLIVGTSDWSRRHRQTVVVTAGAKGAVVSSPEEHFFLDAPAIVPLDTVGAGDTFCGFFAAELSKGIRLRDAAQLAVIAASRACLVEGAQASIPERMDVLQNIW